jgi:3-methyladenine DNA glycosylase Tag
MPATEKFQSIYQRACDRKGGEDNLLSLVSEPRATQAIKLVGDDRILSEFSKKVFQSGFVWRVVEKKWPDFEEVFWDFDIDKLIMMSDEMLEPKSQNPAIIRNYVKVKSIRANAYMMHDVRCDGKSFAELIADWPCEDIVGLWSFLKAKGARLGGNTGPYGLRAIGKDTFLLSRDVEDYLRQRDVFTGGATSKRSLQQIQSFFNNMQQESGHSLQVISQIISLSVGDNHRGIS